jgi:hypothetical protein
LESPTPNADTITSFLILYALIASRLFLAASVRSRGGDVGSEKGLSVFLFDANAMIIASGRELDEVMARSMSCFINGDPVVIVRPGVGVRDEGSRTRR